MNTLKAIQDQINSLVYTRFENYAGDLNLSVPLIPRISEDFLDNGVMLIGQETNTWYRAGDDDLSTQFLSNRQDIESVCLVNRYDKFVAENAPYYPGKFWEFSRLLYDKGIISGEIVKKGRLSHCWMNLFFVEACKAKQDKRGCPTNNQALAKRIIEIQATLLFEILAILQPRLIIALTGHSLDSIFLISALNSDSVNFLEVDSTGLLGVSQLAQLQIMESSHPLFGVKILRTYHPSYFMARINTHPAIQENFRKQKVGLSPARFYTETVLSKLSKW